MFCLEDACRHSEWNETSTEEREPGAAEGCGRRVEASPGTRTWGTEGSRGDPRPRMTTFAVPQEPCRDLVPASESSVLFVIQMSFNWIFWDLQQKES